jgi:hypothetical protein
MTGGKPQVVESDEVPMETLFKSSIYVWTEAATGIRYGIHVPYSANANADTVLPLPPPMDSDVLRNLTLGMVHVLSDVTRPFVLIHFQPTTARIELSLPDLGSEEEVRTLSQTAENGPVPFLRKLVQLYTHDVSATDGSVCVEYVEVRYNAVSDLTDSTKHAVLHDARATIAPAPALAAFIRQLEHSLPPA